MALSKSIRARSSIAARNLPAILPHCRSWSRTAKSHSRRLTWLPSPVAPYHRRLEAGNAVRQHRLQRGARVVRTSSSNLDLRMRRPRLLGIFLLAAALMPTGAEFAVARSADEDDVSVPLEWRNQII